MFTLLYVKAQTAFATRNTGGRGLLGGGTGASACRRGVTMLEYMLMAAIALALFIILRGALGDSFSNLIERIQTALGK